MSKILRTGHAFNLDQSGLNRISQALQQSELTFARVQGMKLRAKLNPPRAATGGFPYRARNCAQWTATAAKAERRK